MEGKSQPFRKRAGLTPFFLRPPHLLPVKCLKLCVHGHDLIREGTLRQGGSGQPHFDPLLPTIHATSLRDLCFFPQRTWSSEHLQQSQPGQGELHQVSLWGGSKTSGGSGGRVCLQCGRPGFDPWVKLFHVSVARNREDKLIPHKYIKTYLFAQGFPGDSVSRESTCNAGDPGSIPGWGRSPGEGMAAHSSILAWKIPWTEKPGRLQSMGSPRVRHNLVTKPIVTQSRSTYIYI